MRHTILVVDDNPTVRAVVQRILQVAGHKAIVAEDGIQALELFGQHDVEAAIVDVDMPGPNGVEVCRQLYERAAGSGRAIFVWLMTGFVRPEIVTAAEAAGALGVFAKPFTMEEITSCIDRQLHRRAIEHAWAL